MILQGWQPKASRANVSHSTLKQTQLVKLCRWFSRDATHVVMTLDAFRREGVFSVTVADPDKITTKTIQVNCQLVCASSDEFKRTKQ